MTILAAVLAGALGAWAGSPSPTACSEAGQALAAHIRGYRVDCAGDSDCGASYLAADSCAPAFVFNKSVDVGADRELSRLQGEAAKSCAAIFLSRPVCDPIPAKPVCRSGRCVDAASAAAVAPPAAPAAFRRAAGARFSAGTAQNGCAPNDSQSLELILSPKALACDAPPSGAALRLQIWDAEFVSKLKPGFDLGVDASQRTGFGLLCVGHQCKTLRSFRVRVISVDAKVLKGRVEATLEDGTRVSDQPFEAARCASRAICG